MLIHEITLRGILSFGPDTPPLEMRPLNVLIGPNGSGKSNLLEAVNLMRSAPEKLHAPLRSAGGGVNEWLWKGDPNGHAVAQLVIGRDDFLPLRHLVDFRSRLGKFELRNEVIADGDDPASVYYRLTDGPVVRPRGEALQPLEAGRVSASESILSQVRDPSRYPEFDLLDVWYSGCYLYREWSFCRSSVFRQPQAADLPSDRLEEDFSNLGLFLNHLRGNPTAKRRFIEHLRDLYEGLDDFDVRVKGGTVEVFLTEGEFIIPASRLSDGTLRYLCLLAILCDPEPPELICIEEPELGLHPDMITKIADLLVAASERTQLIVTTHSDILIDALTEHPGAVVVFEKHDGQTQMRRLEETDELKKWLEKYRLGQLWTRGEIGGTRW